MTEERGDGVETEGTGPEKKIIKKTARPRLGATTFKGSFLSISTGRNKKTRAAHNRRPRSHGARSLLHNGPLWDFYTAAFDAARCDFSKDAIHSRHVAWTPRAQSRWSAVQSGAIGVATFSWCKVRIVCKNLNTQLSGWRP